MNPSTLLKRLAFCAAACGLGLRLAAAAENVPESWTPEHILRVRGITACVPSPDGRRVTYAVRVPLMDDTRSEYVQQVWVADAEGGTASRHFAEAHSCMNPQWSPDGKAIGVVAVHKGGTNLWLVSPDHAPPQELTRMPTGVRDFQWSPDGRRIAFSATFPRPASEELATRAKTDARVVGENPPRVGLYVIDVAAATSGKRDVRRISPDTLSVFEFDWAPDGRVIAFGHRPTLSDNDWEREDVSLVDVDSGRVSPLMLTAVAKNSPRFSPDGKWVACILRERPGTRAANRAIWLIAADGSEKRKLADNSDASPGLMGWLADGRNILFREVHRTQWRVGTLPVDGGPPVVLSPPGGVITAVSVNATGTHVGFCFETVERPPEAFVSRLDRFAPRQVSRINEDLPLPPLGRTETTQWTSSDGRQVEGLLTRPVGCEPGRKYPLLVLIHGGPAGYFCEDFLGSPHLYYNLYPVASFAARGYAVLRPNPRGSSGYGIAFRNANYEDWGGGDFRDVMAGVDHVIAMGLADPARLGIMGWSYGGYLTAWTITQTKRFSAASVGSGMIDLISQHGTSDSQTYLFDYFGAEFWDRDELYLRRSPIMHVRNVVTPTLIQHGERDVRIPLSQGTELHTALLRRGVPTRMVVYPREGHVPAEPKHMLHIMRENLDWMDRYVRGVAPSGSAGAARVSSPP